LSKNFKTQTQQIFFLALAAAFLSLPVSLLVGMLVHEVKSEIIGTFWAALAIYFLTVSSILGIVFLLQRKIGIGALTDKILESSGSKDALLGIPYIMTILIFSVIEKIKK
jgi:hypothetical protein